MRRRAFAAWLTAVVALSAAVRHADDPTSSPSLSTSGAKLDRHGGIGSHVTLTQRYIDRKLEELETRLGRRMVEQAKRLNHSITIHYLEKVTFTSAEFSTVFNLITPIYPIAYHLGYLFSSSKISV